MGLFDKLKKGNQAAEADKKLANILGNDAKREVLLKMVTATTLHNDILKLIEITGSPDTFDAAEVEKMAKKYFGADLSGMDPTKILASVEPALNGYAKREALQEELFTKAALLRQKEKNAKTELEKKNLKLMKNVVSGNQKFLDQQNQLAGIAAFYTLLYGTLRGHGGVWSKDETKDFEWLAQNFNLKSQKGIEQLKKSFGGNAEDFVKRQAIQRKKGLNK